jgi:hypothetical protein
MPIKFHFKKTIGAVLIFCCMQMGSYAQGRRAELTEMKDSINLLVSSIKALEKETTPDKLRIVDRRTRLMVLLIYNNDKQCGAWPAPSGKIEEFELYWKCVFENAPYGKKFVLSY